MEQCRCQSEDSENFDYIGFCDNEECERFYCEQCQGDHAAHPEDVLVGQELEEYMEYVTSPEYEKEIEQQELAQEFTEFYERIIKENEEETKMFYLIIQYLKDGNADELVKLLDKIKQTKVEFDNNKPMQISKQMDEYRKRIRALDEKFPTGDVQKRQKKIELMNKGMTHLYQNHQGRQLFKQQEYFEALENLQQAIGIDNDYVEAILIKAQTQIQLENYDEAITGCDYVIQIDRLNGEAYYLKIIALLLSQKYDVINEALRVAYRKISYKFTFNTLNLINQLEKQSPAVQQHLSQLNYDFKHSLFSLINYEQITAQISQQYLTQFVAIIRLADQEEINRTLFQYNQNFEVVEEYQKQYDVDIRPKLDEKEWKKMVEWLENYKKNQEQQQAQAALTQGDDQQGGNQQGENQQGENQQRDDQQGDNQQRENQQRENQQRDDQQGDNQQGENQQRENQQRDDQQGDNQQGENQQRENQQGDNQQGDSQQGKNQQGGNQQGDQNKNQQSDQQSKDQLQTQSASVTQVSNTDGNESSRVQSEINNFYSDSQSVSVTQSEQQESIVKPQGGSITEQPSSQIVDQFNNFLQDASTIQEQPRAQGQAPLTQNPHQDTNQLNKDFQGFLSDGKPDQETPNEQQQIENPEKEKAKIIPTPKPEQQLSDFYKEDSQDQNNQPNERAQQAAVAQEVTPQVQKDLQNFLSGQEQYQQQQQQEQDITTLDETKRLLQVLKYCDQTIKKGNAAHQFYFKKAMTLKQLNDFDNAMDNLDIAIEKNDNQASQANYYYQKALLLIRLDALDLALNNFDEAISRNPNEIQYYKEKGNVLIKQDRLNEAEDCFQQAKQITEAIK